MKILTIVTTIFLPLSLVAAGTDELHRDARAGLEVRLPRRHRGQRPHCEPVPVDHEKEKILVTSILCMTSSQRRGKPRVKRHPLACLGNSVLHIKGINGREFKQAEKQ